MEENQQANCLFRSFCLRPNVRFETQREEEKIILLVRAHPVTQLHYIINSVVFLIFLVFLNLIPIPYLTFSQLIFINLMGIVFIFSYLWINFLKWFFNVGIVTNERVIDIDFSHLTYKEFTQAKIGKIEDVTSKINGYIDNIFNYGNIFVQTAGTDPNIEFMHVPKPNEVVKIINGLVSK
jgi:hypothetical protein